MDAYHQAPEHEEVVVEPASEHLERRWERHERRVKIETTAAWEDIGKAELGGTPGRDSG